MTSSPPDDACLPLPSAQNARRSLLDAADDRQRRAQALSADLSDLALDLEAGGYSPTTVAMFHRDLRRAVPSALGATVSYEFEKPTARRLEINLLDRTVDPAEIATGLRIPLPRHGSGLDGSVLFYASAQGAFDALVRDLLVLFYACASDFDQSPALPSSPVSPSVADLQDLSVVNHALGVLLSRGYSLSEARAGIRDRVALTQTSLPDAARALLDTLPTRRGPQRASLPSLPVSVASRATDDPRLASDALIRSLAPGSGPRPRRRSGSGRQADLAS